MYEGLITIVRSFQSCTAFLLENKLRITDFGPMWAESAKPAAVAAPNVKQAAVAAARRDDGVPRK